MRAAKLKLLLTKRLLTTRMISLIVGLGNPGNEYKKTRHNAGFLLLDALAARYQTSFKKNEKFNAEFAQIDLAGHKVGLIKPQTFMNRSGLSVQAAMKYFDIPVEQVLVVHDELDLPVTDVRLKKSGGHGGHNGLRDIFAHVGSREFYRLRIGIDHPGDKRLVSNYVLKNMSKQEQLSMNDVIDRILVEIPDICSGQFEAVMRRLHT